MWFHSQCQYLNTSNNNSLNQMLSLYSLVIKMWFHSQCRYINTSNYNSLNLMLSLYSQVIKR